MKDEVLLRKWRPLDAVAEDECKVVYQILVPEAHRKKVVSLDHDSPMAGHIGVSKTHNRILTHLYWPNIRIDIAECGRSGHTCKVVGETS